MKKQQLLSKLELAWQQFKQSIDRLTESQMTEPGVIGDWSIKDILAHISTWEEEALKNLPIILNGGRVPRYKDLYGGLDAFNAQMTAQKSGLSLSEIGLQLDTIHKQLLVYLDTIPEENFNPGNAFPAPPSSGHIQPLPRSH